MKSAESSRDIAKIFENTKRPDCKLLTGCYKKIDEMADEISMNCDLAEQLNNANAPIEQILYVMLHDYTGESYYPSRIIPPGRQFGCTATLQNPDFMGKKSAGL